MKKYLLALVLFISTGSFAQNLTLRSNLPYAGSLANIGGYVDSLGNEYALVGWSGGLDIVDVTDPANPVVKQTIPGTNSGWREVKTWEKYAYVTTEGGSLGLQIIDMSTLPGAVTYKYWKGNNAITGQINRIHALHIDNNGYLYLFGCNNGNLFNGAAIISSLDDPWNPNFVGHTTGPYVHDGYAENDTLYACNIDVGNFTIWNVANKANPIYINSQTTPGSFTHNSWLNDEHTVLFTTDESTNSYLTAYDISVPTNIKELSRIQVTPGSNSIVHNTHTINDFEVVSWYKDGVVIVDVSRPKNMIITGHYDTYPQGSGSGYDGCWGVYPFLPSGNIVAADISNGLFVFTPSYVRGCYLEGNVKDSATNSIIFGATVTVVGQNITKQTDVFGDYRTGLATAGTYTVKISKTGYYTQTFNNVALNNGVLTIIDAALVPISFTSVSGTVVDELGNPVPNALVVFSSELLIQNFTCDALGQFSLPSIIADQYDIVAGKWGYLSSCDNLLVAGSPLTLTITSGHYYDDFSLNFNWTTAGSSPNAWERGIPVETKNGNSVANPGSDDANDCLNFAMVTDNGGGGAWDNDVDLGTAMLISPVFDATIYANPYVNYTRWFYSGGKATVNGFPNDTMKVFLDNGTSRVIIETANPSSPDSSTWVPKSFRIADFLTPTNNMHFIITVKDSQPINNIAEGGLDHFELIAGTTGINNADNSIDLVASPNPFANTVSIKYDFASASGISVITIFDVLGHEVYSTKLNGSSGELITGAKWPAGVYIARILSGNNISTLRLSKAEK